MKNDWSRSFYRQIAVNICYSALIACLVDAFLIMNMNFLLAYLDQTRYANLLILQIFKMGTITTILYVIVGIGIFALAFLMIEKKNMKYIGKIAVAIQNISEGDLNTQIEVMGDNEFSAMASNLNRMEADIRKLMDKERESERTKNELITNVAHDLRTPLTSIIGYLEEFYPSFADKDLTYELKSNVPSQIITADGNLLARLFDNLINNAIKYGAEGKKVLIQVFAKDDIVTVSVTNYGYVIPAEELPLIFNKFYRVEQSRSSKTGGTGLGLAIAKNIVDMHGGTISVASDLNGTVFTVKLKVDFDVNKENFGMIQ